MAKTWVEIQHMGKDWDEDGLCDSCGAKAVWPPTGEPCVAVCTGDCYSKAYDEKIQEEKHLNE